MKIPCPVHKCRQRELSRRRLIVRVIMAIAALSFAVICPCPSCMSFAKSPLGPEASGERIAFSARVEGYWHIFSVRADGGDLRRLTHGETDNRAPAYSPDGAHLLFQSRRSGQWHIYMLSLSTGEVSQLTDHPAYDGRPTWSPDGTHIAFESMRDGDLDIFVMHADGSNLVNLTVDSPFGEIEPAWSPDGKWIIFSSWRFGDKDLFVISPDGLSLQHITSGETGEDSPTWAPDGQKVAFVQRTPETREIFVIDAQTIDGSDAAGERITWSTANEWPAWSPDSLSLAWLEQSYSGWSLLSARIGELTGLPHEIIRGEALAGPLSWSDKALNFGDPVEAERLLPQMERPFALRWEDWEAGDQPPLVGWQDVPNVKVPNERLNAGVAPRFIAWREAIIQATGRDFLSVLSDAWRPLDVDSDTSSYSSWHKTGRAVDTLFELRDRRGWPLLEVVREDIGRRTYWRLYLRCALQDGSQGEPLREHPWDLSATARLEYPDWGGRPNTVPVGYYVDLTDLAERYGWGRIAAVDRPDYSWKWHFLAIEYWHFQQDEGMDWYSALLEVYPVEEIQTVIHWDEIIEAEALPEWRIAYSGVPVPMNERRWGMLLP